MSELLQKLKAALAERYQLEIELGSGGMATVYLALDIPHQRRVAIKVLHPRLAGAVGQDRFLQEIRFAAELAHPHILPLLDSGTVILDGRPLPYYVMPFVEGESLRVRLQRQKQLPIEEAVAIARDVASALTYAHGHKVVHRDIKPENILLAGNEALVADFGIARAINRAAESEVITTEGMAVGTPAYMSPEQSMAVEELDGRSDIYSLGCVLYEMLGGEPPFTGATPHAIVARHQMDPVPSLVTIRPTVPPALELTVKKALQKQPADRFQTAAELSRALEASTTGRTATVETGRWRSNPRLWTLLVVLVLIVAGTLAAILVDGKDTSSDGMVLDTTLFAVIPSQSAQSVLDNVDPSLLLLDALAGWEGVKLVDAFQVQGAVTRQESENRGEDWGRIARDLKAGRYIRMDVSRVGNSLRVSAVLYDTKTNEQLANRAERVAPDFSNADSVFAVLAEHILFRDNLPKTKFEPVVGTRIMPARQAFQQGYRALEEWDLPAADSAFDAATRHDPQFAQASLWLAMVRMWKGESVDRWRSPIERANAGRDRLSDRDRRVADVVMAQAGSDYVRACRLWEQFARHDRYSFIAWYGLADCLKRDNIVLPDAGSPTGWRFRSSYHRAIEAYQRAFELLPSMHRTYGEESFASTRRLLHTSENDLRGGRAAPPDTMMFFAAPSWRHDSLVFYPIPYQEMAAGRSPSTATTADAVLHQRQRFQRIAAAWVASSPTSAEAMLALAASLEIQGDRTALDVLLKARTLAVTPRERLRVAAEEVRMLVKFSIPEGLAGLRRARAMADSILAQNASANPIEARLLATLAALTGRAYQAARLSVTPEMLDTWGVPSGLVKAAPLRVYAAMGQPGDSLTALERQVAMAIDQDVALSERQEIKLEWLAFPATLAFPEHRLSSINTLEGKGDILLNAQAAFARGDSASVRRMLLSLKATRKQVRPSDMALDNLFLEAWLLVGLGDLSAAAQWLDPTLSAIASSAPQLFSDPYRIGPIIRAMALRAELADRLGDHSGAQRWASAVVALWSGADDILQPLVRRMDGLTH